MEGYLLELNNLKLVSAPVDMGAAATTGARISMVDNNRVSFIVMLGAGTAATAEFVLQQHNAATGGTTKALAITNPYFVKAGAATAFTRVEVPTELSSFDISTTFATAAGLVVFEVLAEDLDRDNGFTHISLNATDAGATARLGAVLAQASQVERLPAYSNVL